MKRLKQIGALLSIAVLIGFGLGAMILRLSTRRLHTRR